MDGFDKQHVKSITACEKKIQALIDECVRKITTAASMAGIDVSKPFNINDYPRLKIEADRLIKQLHKDIKVTIEKAEGNEWERSNNKNDELVASVIKAQQIAKKAGYMQRNDEALAAFMQRKVNGMNLSDRVWNMTDQFRTQIETAIEVAIKDHKTADELSRDVRQYLKYPDKLFRRVRGEDGVLRLSKNAKAFHPGQGVYRSSYMNARRLAGTEINMAYRTSDDTRRRQLDFVVGIEVHLSNNHNCKGVPEGQFVDICDELKGRYPKDFKFVGWHPNCRCYTTSILKTKEEIEEDMRRIAHGQPPKKGSVNEVKDTPSGFKGWVEDNQDRISRAKSMPYFLRDNGKMVDGEWVMNDNIGSKNVEPSILDLAAKRHAERTPEKVEDIRTAWKKRQEKHDIIKKAAGNVLKVAMDYGEVDFSDLRDAIDAGNLMKMQTYTKTVAQAISAVKKQESAISNLIPNAHTLHKSYSMSELQTAHKELDVVMKKWLSKYNYSSLEAAPLQHLKNKFDFELTNLTNNYSQKDIVKKAITDNIQLIDRKIEWNDLLTKAATLKTFKTKSTIFKNSLTKIEDAIQNKDFNALQKNIAEAEKQQQRLVDSKIKKGVDAKTALNKEYKGGAVGRDITAGFDVSKMTSEDPYRGTFTNNAARMQGFDAPAKLVSEQEFDILEKSCGDVFYRTVNPTTFKGKRMSSAEFSAQLYKADLLELNGPGGRVHGDGMYVATSAWDGYNIHPLTKNRKINAYDSSICYGNGNHTISEMTWTRKPKIIKKSELKYLWNKLSVKDRAKFGNHMNTYGCAIGYDAMYCDGVDYLVIWNRSIIAVKNK